MHAAEAAEAWLHSQDARGRSVVSHVEAVLRFLEAERPPDAVDSFEAYSYAVKELHAGEPNEPTPVEPPIEGSWLEPDVLLDGYFSTGVTTDDEAATGDAEVLEEGETLPESPKDTDTAETQETPAERTAEQAGASQEVAQAVVAPCKTAPLDVVLTCLWLNKLGTGPCNAECVVLEDAAVRLERRGAVLTALRLCVRGTHGSYFVFDAALEGEAVVVADGEERPPPAEPTLMHLVWWSLKRVWVMLPWQYVELGGGDEPGDEAPPGQDEAAEQEEPVEAPEPTPIQEDAYSEIALTGVCTDLNDGRTELEVLCAMLRSFERTRAWMPHPMEDIQVHRTVRGLIRGGPNSGFFYRGSGIEVQKTLDIVS